MGDCIPAPPPAAPRNTYVYVDGFNLYYGSLKGTPYRWLDLASLCRLLLPATHHRIQKIKYFTAKVSATPAKPQTDQHQETYLRSLRTQPDVEIFFGHFLTHEISMPLAVRPTGEPPRPSTAYQVSGGPTKAWVRKTEEKGSDVNLATHLLYDGWSQRYEFAVVITNDSDLLEPIRLVRTQLRKGVGILNPHPTASRVLSAAATFTKSIRRSGILNASQFPPNLTDAAGSFSKPPGW